MSKPEPAVLNRSQRRHPEEWRTPSDLALWLHVPEATLYQWRHRGIGPRAHKIGRHLRYRDADVEVWLAQQVSA